jgi:hypothetical protein
MKDQGDFIKHFAELLEHKFIDELRFKADSPDDTALSEDINSLIRHIIFLYRLGHLPVFYASPKRFLKAALLHYTVPNSSGTDGADIRQWRRRILMAIDRLSPGTVAKVRLEIPRELFVWYWTELDATATFFSSVIKIMNGPDEGTESATIKDVWNPKALILRANDLDNKKTYDEYLRDLSKRIYQKDEYYDLILIDSNNVDEYRSKGAIESYQLVFHGKKVSKREKSGSRHLGIGHTVNGVLDALPVTRNFHLPGSHRKFDENPYGKGMEGLEPLFGAVGKFIGAANYPERYNGDASELISEDVRSALYEYFWAPDLNAALRGLASGIFNGQVSVPELSASRSFSAVLTSSDQENPKLIPFIIGFGSGYNFIPMQLARGAHAAYTFMAYTANIPLTERGKIPLPSFISIQQSNGQHQDGDLPTIVVVSARALQARLSKVLNLAFNFVPDGSLCFDHHFSAYVRNADPLTKFWFDPCLPIEAVSFQEDIEVLPSPAYFEPGRSLTCIGGFCFGVSERASDASQAALVASDFVLKLAQAAQTERNESTRNSRLRTARMALRNNHCMLTYSDLAQLELISDEARKKGEQDDKLNIPTPASRAVRPNFGLWPHIEAEISDTFRLYMAALFVYRAIHFEISALDTTNMANNELYRRSVRFITRGSGNVHPGEATKRFFGVVGSSEYTEPSEDRTGEHLAIAELRSKDILAYLENLRNTMKVLAAKMYERRALSANVEDNMKPLLADADYLLGILRDCAEKSNSEQIKKIQERDLENKGEHAGAQKRRIERFLSLRDAMVNSLAENLARTVSDKVQSYCQMHGYTVETFS